MAVLTSSGRLVMHVAAVIASFGLAACYVPEFRDCAVACSTDADCAKGHVCGEGLCVTPGGSCGVAPADGAPVTVVDAAPDAPRPTGMLRVRLAEQGRVEVSGIGTCDRVITDRCDFIVELGESRTLLAIPAAGREFEHWDKACVGTDPTCDLVPGLPLTEVEAKFRKVD
jgi:hypothetical protein